MSPPQQPRRKPDVDRLLERFAAEEQAFLDREFLAPSVNGGRVRVRIGNVVCTIAIEPRDFVGWGVFKPDSHTRARFVRTASLAERRQYVQFFPMLRLIICRRAGSTWFGSTASFGDRRIQLEGMAPVLLADEVQLFDTIRTRYDGASFWFEDIDMRHDPGASSYLRDALARQTPPDMLARKGLTAEERAAYEVNYWQSIQPADRPHAPQRNAQHRPRTQRGRVEAAPPLKDEVAVRLHESLSHAGATLIDYLERGDSYRVTYLVGGQAYTSSVDKRDLGVQVAGICLSGEDHKFDLASLVGVLREGEGEGGIVQVGDGGRELGVDDYWRVHPRRDR